LLFFAACLDVQAHFTPFMPVVAVLLLRYIAFTRAPPSIEAAPTAHRHGGARSISPSFGPAVGPFWDGSFMPPQQQGVS
jgi:hypothetical protein